MALACLFHQLKQQKLGSRLDLTALIVDHAHRPDSAQEARTVSQWLEKMGWYCPRLQWFSAEKYAGIKSRVLKVRWPSGQEPSRAKNFESIARQARYRHLAYECLHLEIKYLFLGHHLDDQVETILFRLARGQTVASSGLRGMRPANSIPCCEDILGAHDGFDASSLSELLGMTSPPMPTNPNLESSSSASSLVSDSIPVSHGGIKIYRPFLSFPKRRLIATCEANAIPFVTDPSNYDIKTTERNAIRWLLSNNKLPMALRQDSVLLLSAASVRQEEARKNKLAELMKVTQLVRLDLRSSRLIVRTPIDVEMACKASEKEAAYYVHHLAGLVSPRPDYSQDFSRLYSIARWMFPALREVGTSALDKPLDLRSCTAHNVLIERLTDGTLWQFTRRPFHSYQTLNNSFVPAPNSSKGTDKDWSNWTAWDERYFFRIRTRNPEDVRHFRIRRLEPSDMQDLSATSNHLSPSFQKHIRDTLRDAAPGKIRYTLPVLLKDEEMCALPTLGIAIPSKKTLQAVEENETLSNELQWEVRYKNITETLQYWKTPLSNVDYYEQHQSESCKTSDLRSDMRQMGPKVPKVTGEG